MKNKYLNKIIKSKINLKKKPIVTHIITGLERGGAERFLFNFLTTNLNGKIKNNVISLMSEGYYGPLLKKKNITINCLNMNRGKFNLASLKNLKNILENQEPDIIQGWMYHGNLAALAGTFMLKKKIMLSWNIRLSLEVFPQMKLTTRLAVKLCALFSKKIDSIIYNSKRSLLQHRKIGFSKSNDYFIPNGFDLKKWHPSKKLRTKIRKLLKISKKTKVIGYVGRGEEQKDLPNLFKAFNIVKKKNPNIILIAVGKNLKKYASNSDKIIFLGQRSDVHDLMPSFDILCLSSKAEGFPNVIGEAMSTGLPCITTDVGDAKEIVGDTGWVVPVNNPLLFAKCIVNVMKIPREKFQKYGKSARKKIINNYDINYVKNEYISLYHSLLNKLK
ncbi:glycosyltransferase [Pelagibacterales bacterium SAG-MED18]|nr:glycosyltransferase [Pelagibacterales bacterium SAG-MED18]